MAHILEGSVQKSGDAVRVNVQLIKAANDSHHAAARESWREARSELEPFLKEQPQNYNLIGDLALTNMGLGDKAAALALSERGTTVISPEKDAIAGARPIEIVAGWERA